MSGMPANNSAWPPAEHADRYSRFPVELAWYGGSSERLAAAYGGANTHHHPAGAEGDNRVMRALRTGWNALWGNIPTTGDDTRRHLPTATDIAVISSELLYSETPRFVVDGPVHEVDVMDPTDPEKVLAKAGDPTDETIALQARLDYILDGCNFRSTLLAAGETASAMGSVALRVAWNKNVGAIKDRPVITRVDADAVIPNYMWGQLQGVIFWSVVQPNVKDQGATYRHLELHQDGMIQHGLFRGELDNLGVAVPLTHSDATKDIRVDAESALPNRYVVGEAAVFTAVSIPNMLPDPMDRKNAVGRSDYTAAVIDLLDAGDRLYTHMLEAEEDGKSRLVIARSLLENKGAGKGLEYDNSQRVFQRVNMPPSEKEGGGLPIEQIQFEMRLEEYWTGIERLYERTIKAAGYNPQTMGTEGDVPVTATEWSGRNKRSMSTRDKKIGYAQPMLEALLTGLLVVDEKEFGGAKPYPVRVEFPEAIQPTFAELLADAKAMKDAGLNDMLTIVKHVYPDWTDTEAQELVDRIANTTQVLDPITLGAGRRGPGLGVTRGDGLPSTGDDGDALPPVRGADPVGG